jgi:hypothetical protein
MTTRSQAPVLADEEILNLHTIEVFVQDEIEYTSISLWPDFWSQISFATLPKFWPVIVTVVVSPVSPTDGLIDEIIGVSAAVPGTARISRIIKQPINVKRFML